MNANERRRYDMLIRVRQFGDDNAPDFAAGTIGATQFAAVTAAVGDTEAMGASQQGGFAEAGQQYEVKSTMRENLREHMSDISRTARSMEYAFNGIQDKFRLPRNRNDADLLNTGRAFRSSPPAGGGVAALRRRGGGSAAPYNADFQAYGLAATFIADLTFCSPPARGGVAAFRRRGGGSDAFEASFGETATATAEHVAATAETAESIRQGMIAVRSSPPA